MWGGKFPVVWGEVDYVFVEASRLWRSELVCAYPALTRWANVVPRLGA
jgi:hypothetical protein